MKKAYWVFFIFLSLLLASCAGPSAIAREGWTLIDVLTTSERRDFQSESVDVRNCGIPAAAERKSTSCSASSSASFSLGVEESVEMGAQAGVNAGIEASASLNVSVGASAAVALGFDRSSGESLDLDTPEQGFVNRYRIEKEFRILNGQGRIQHKDGDVEDGVYTLQTGCFLRIERVEILTCEAASTPTPRPTPMLPTHTPTPIPFKPDETPTRAATPIPAEPTVTPTINATTETEQSEAGAIREIEGITFVYVPVGEFTMGSDDFRDIAAKPVHRVYLDGYWIMHTEVTNAQYERFIDAGGYTTEGYWTVEGWKWRSDSNISLPKYWSDSNFNNAQQPVNGISWYEAVAYANWLTEASGLNLRLPTEAEWEKAARGTDGRILPWGNKEPKEHLLNFGHVFGIGGDLMPVGSYPEGASPYGVLDMAGNVMEWASDWYNEDYYADSPTRNPPGPATGSLRIMRGGSWRSEKTLVRATYRSAIFPTYRSNQNGFRLVAPGL